MKPRIEHLPWTMFLVFVAIGWSMKGSTTLEEWQSVFSFMAFSNLVFAALWIIEREKVGKMRRLLDPEIQRHFR